MDTQRGHCRPRRHGENPARVVVAFHCGHDAATGKSFRRLDRHRLGRRRNRAQDPINSALASRMAGSGAERKNENQFSRHAGAIRPSSTKQSRPWQLLCTSFSYICLVAETFADPGHRAGHHRRRGAARRSGRAQSQRAVQIRHRAGGRPRRAGIGECQQPEGRHRRRPGALPALHQRPGHARSGLPAAGHRLSQRVRGAP